MRFFKKGKGFTLLELIFVVLIIGILASLAMPFYTKAKERALDQEMINYLRLIKAAQLVFHSEQGRYFGPIAQGDSQTNSKASAALHIELPPDSFTTYYFWFLDATENTFTVFAMRSSPGYTRSYVVDHLSDVRCGSGNCQVAP